MTYILIWGDYKGHFESVWFFYLLAVFVSMTNQVQIPFSSVYKTNKKDILVNPVIVYAIFGSCCKFSHG